MKRIVIILVLALTPCQSQFGSLKALREKTKKVQNSVKIKKVLVNANHFVSRTEFLYPGLDEKKIKMVKDLWQDYYDCQEALYVANQKLVVPEALTFLQGSNAVLECEVCESPRDLFTPTRWFYSANYDMNNLRVIEDTSKIFMQNNSLYIYNMEDSRGGMYVCKKGPHSARPYIVNIFSKEKTRKVVPERNKDGPYPVPDAALPELYATVTTVWAEWTQCSRCGITGRKYRTGICTVVGNKYMPGYRTKRKTYLPSVKIIPLDIGNQTTQPETSAVTEEGKLGNQTTQPEERKNRSLEDSNQTTQPTTSPVTEEGKNQSVEETIQNDTSHSTTRTYYTTNANLSIMQIGKPDKSVIPESRNDSGISSLVTNLTTKTDLELLDIFQDGIPCRSLILSEHTRNSETLVKRSSEIMVAYCKLSCPENVVFVVVNGKGEVVETANNSEGVYSLRQGLPQDFPPVSRNVEFASFGKYYRIQCPGHRFGDIPIEWYVGKKLLTNTLLDKETHGRVRIDEYGRIAFENVLYEDSRVFSCWQQKELVGTVRLLVEKEQFILNFKSPVTIIGTLIIFATFSWVYYIAFTLS